MPSTFRLGLTCALCGNPRTDYSKAHCVACARAAQMATQWKNRSSFALGFKCEECGKPRHDCSRRFCCPKCTMRFHNRALMKRKQETRAALKAAQRLSITAWTADANGVLTRIKFTEARAFSP